MLISNIPHLSLGSKPYCTKFSNISYRFSKNTYLHPPLTRSSYQISDLYFNPLTYTIGRFFKNYLVLLLYSTTSIPSFQVSSSIPFPITHLVPFKTLCTFLVRISKSSSRCQNTGTLILILIHRSNHILFRQNCK